MHDNDLCYHEIALNSGNVNICDKIESDKQKLDCKNLIRYEGSPL